MLPLTWRRQVGCLAALVPLLLGCGGKASVGGKITYDGKEVDKGFITFYPADDRGTAVGSEVRDGHYSVPEIEPGKKRVLISTQAQPVVVSGSGTEGRRVRLVRPEHAIPADATGNNRTVDIGKGDQALDFELTKLRRQ